MTHLKYLFNILKTSYSLFSGAGGADCGMATAGYQSLGGIEHHAPAAAIYDLNHEAKVTRANILEIDRIPTVDLLWASPPCPAFSIANPDRGETQKDIKLAKHIAKLIVESRPRHIAIENVRGYASSQSLNIIWAAMENAGYAIESRVHNAANYGAPTTRERLIVRASLERLGDVVVTHRSPRAQLPLFPLPNWVNWYDAVSDRLDKLPQSHLTDNQRKVLERQGIELPMLVDGAGNNYGTTLTTRTIAEPAHTITGSIAKHPVRLLIDLNQSRQRDHFTVRQAQQPAHTIAATHGRSYNSKTKILIGRVGYYNGEPNTYDRSQPAPTIRAHQHIDDKGTYRVSHNILNDCEVYAADIQCLAAWQGFPDDYQWGDNRGEAGRAIGNAVPPPLSLAVARSFA
jgi:DNA (cytosine-5)-methyltransferase 1